MQDAILPTHICKHALMQRNGRITCMFDYPTTSLLHKRGVPSSSEGLGSGHPGMYLHVGQTPVKPICSVLASHKKDQALKSRI